MEISMLGKTKSTNFINIECLTRLVKRSIFIKICRDKYFLDSLDLLLRHSVYVCLCKN